MLGDLMQNSLFISIILALALSGCAAQPTLQRTELFFGLNRAGHEAISDREWRQFVDEVVTPRFPSGLTILDARGQWRGSSGAIESEPSRVMILLHAPSREEDRKIEEIRALYKQRFDQEAVMRTDSTDRVSF